MRINVYPIPEAMRVKTETTDSYRAGAGPRDGAHQVTDLPGHRPVGYLPANEQDHGRGE